MVFLLLLGGLLGGACFILPDETARNTMLGAQVDKLKRLSELSGERIIIVGGSGSGQGFVTSSLCATLNRPVFNMGLHAGLGLIYQMKAVAPYVHMGDKILLIPEYENFNGSSCYGDAELLMMVLDIIPEQKSLISIRHWFHILTLLPKYGADKLRHLGLPSRGKDYSKDFDCFGDSKWSSDLPPLAQKPFPKAKCLTENGFSSTVIRAMDEFVAVVRATGGEVYVFPPAYQRSSFDRQVRYIGRITTALNDAGLPFVVPPEHYALSDNYFFDTPYHLNMAGRLFRSQRLCDDIKPILLAGEQDSTKVAQENVP